MKLLCLLIFTIKLLPLIQSTCFSTSFNETPAEVCGKNCSIIVLKKCFSGKNKYSKVKTLQLLDEVTVLKSGAFNNAPELWLIRLNNVGLLKIFPNAFTDLPKANELQVSGNKLGVILYGVFNQLSFKYLELSLNKIKAIDWRAFGDMPRLEYVGLNQNKLKYFSAEWFSDDTKLNDLRLDHNLITSLRPNAFIKFKHLENLSLRGNLISVIDEKVFYGLKSMNNLDISFNNIEFIHPGAFSPKSYIRILQVYLNNLKYLSLDLLRKLQFEKLYLFPNPWICKCLNKIYDFVDKVGGNVGNSSDMKIYLEWNSNYPVCVVVDEPTVNVCEGESYKVLRDDSNIKNYFNVTDYKVMYVAHINGLI